MGRQVFASLYHRDFRLLWLSEAGYAATEAIEMIGRNWILWEMTGSPLALGLMNFSRAIPRLVLGLYAGVLADRVDKRRLLFWAQAATMVSKFIMALLITTGWINIWHIFALAFLSGATMAFISPLRESMTPFLVPREELVNAISLTRGAGFILRMVVPGLAGVLIAFIGVDGIYYIAGAACFFVLYVIVRIRAPTRAVRTKYSTMWADVQAMISFVRSRPTMLRLLVLNLVPMFFAMSYFTLMPVFATDVLSMGVSGYGLLMGVSGVGAGVSALTLAARGRSASTGRTFLISTVVLGVMLLAFSLSHWPYVSLLLMAGVGMANMANRTLVQALLISMTPSSMYGRLMGIHMLDAAMVPLGGMLSGVLAQVYGAPLSLGVMASGVILFSLGIGLASPELRKLRGEVTPTPAIG